MELVVSSEEVRKLSVVLEKLAKISIKNRQTDNGDPLLVLKNHIDARGSFSLAFDILTNELLRKIRLESLGISLVVEIIEGEIKVSFPGSRNKRTKEFVDQAMRIVSEYGFSKE